MAVDGLRVVLDKEPVVPTPTADRLRDAPEQVDAAFLRHVRSYVPFARAGTADDALSIEDYEKRLISLVKDAKAPKGYIVADFGYGKTSTALYTWHRCREAGLLAVPPFQLSRMDDLLRATHGWTRYEIGRRAPALVPDTDALYAEYAQRGADAYAGGDAAIAAKLRDLAAGGQLNLQLTAGDFLTFFARTVELAERAGFAGLVILPDELQQYLDPALRAAREDPIAPLHSLVEAFNTRRGHLKAGIVFSMPTKDLGRINDQRGDLVQRLKADRLGLDLAALYDKRFATRLWDRLAKEFDFAGESPRIVTPETLDGLGQIAARDDLANGPRTVTAAFKFMVGRHLDGATTPLSPTDLVDAFFAGAIPFDGTSKLQRTIQNHLDNRVVAERPEWSRVVCFLGAFPTDGAEPKVLKAAGLQPDAEELRRLTAGDVVLSVGGGRDNQGRAIPYGLTLRGLEPSTGVASDWLTQTIREFGRNYVEGSSRTIERTERAFADLLTRLIFREPGWKLVERVERRATDGTSACLLFEGGFNSTAKRFPRRRVLVRFPRDGEPARGDRDVDLTLDLALERHRDADSDARRAIPGAIERPSPDHARLSLNLYHRDSDQFYPDLQTTLQPIVSPWQVTPLLMLTLHETIEEQRRGSAIPKDADREIEQAFQPLLLDHSLDELFNAALGRPLGAAGVRVLEELVRVMCEALYPEYRTVMGQQHWEAALRDYALALERLPTRHEKQGEEEVEAPKDVVARLFNRSNVALDSFVGTFPDLIEKTADFKGKEPGRVRFRLHPFEEHALTLVRQGERVQVKQGSVTLTTHLQQLGLIYHAAKNRGYRPAEVDALLDLMVKRDLIAVSPQHGTLHEIAHANLDVKDLAVQVKDLTARIQRLTQAFPDEMILTSHGTNLQAIAKELTNRPDKLDERTIRSRDNILRNTNRQLAALLQTKQAALAKALDSLAQEVGRIPASALPRQPIPADFFGAPLELIRSALAEESERESFARAALSQSLTDVRPTGGAEPTDDQVLALHQVLDEAQAEAKRLLLSKTGTDTRAAHLAVAHRTLLAVIDLEHQLVLGASDADPTLRADLDALVLRVRAELSARKAAAITGSGTWESAVGELRYRLNHRQVEQRAAFDARTARYLELLRQHAGLPPTKNPFRTVHNPADPDGATLLLGREAAGLIADQLVQMRAFLQRATSDLRQLRASGDLAYVDDPASAAADIDRLLVEVGDGATLVDDLLGSSRGSALDENSSAVDRRIADLLVDFRSAFDQVQSVGQRGAAIASAARVQQLDDPERKLLAVVNGSGETGPDGADIGTVLERAKEAGIDDSEAVWDGLRSLYAKRRLRLRVVPQEQSE